MLCTGSSSIDARRVDSCRRLAATVRNFMIGEVTPESPELLGRFRFSGGRAMATMPATHRPPGQASAREIDRSRGSARERGYDRRWDKASLAFRRAHPLCLGCDAVGLTSATEVVDHTIPHRGDRELFWERAHWQPACRWHHDVVKQRLEAMWNAGEIGDDDLRLDSDIAKALTLQLDTDRGVVRNSGA